MRHLIIGAVLALVWASPSGCKEEEPTEKQKGKDEAAQKLDYAEGAASALNDRGKGVGQATGQGVGNLIRGIGTGITDVVYPPVTVFLAKEAQDAGVAVNRATEGSSTDEGNEIRLLLAFSQLVKGRVLLHAYDANNLEQGRATSQFVNQPAGSVLDLSIYFNRNLRMSGIHHYNMEMIPPKAVVLSGDAQSPPEVVKGKDKDKEPLDLRLGQLEEEAGPPVRVSLYVIFNTAFEGEVQLRALDASRTEIGRSQKIGEIAEEADSSRTFEFAFHETLSVGSVDSYELFVRSGDGAKSKKKQKKN